jgi:hypothetical protein
METLRKEYWELSERGQLGPRKSISITIRQREQCGYVRFREIFVAKRLSQYRAGEGTSLLLFADRITTTSMNQLFFLNRHVFRYWMPCWFWLILP